MSNEQYDATILELVQLITSASVSQMGKAEFFGYTLDHMIHHYVQIQEGRSDRFNADLFPHDTRKSLDLLTHRLAALVGAEDPLEAAPEGVPAGSPFADDPRRIRIGGTTGSSRVLKLRALPAGS